MMKKLFTTLLLLVSISISCVCVCKADLIYPPSNASHPYVYLNDEFIAGLKDENGNVKEHYAASFNYLKSIANSALPAQPSGGYLSSSISNQLMARALMYALGEFDTAHAKATVEYTLEYLKNPLTKQTYSINVYKDYGTNGIQTGALVYDWCYDVMTAEQRTNLAQYVYNIMYKQNGSTYIQPCRPNNIATGWSDIAGKSVGQPLIYNSIAAVALYDSSFGSEWYEAMMGKIQGTMADAIKAYGTKGALTDGAISYTRDHYTYYVYVLLDRLGATDEQLSELYGNQTPIGYKMLYSRLPYGATLKQGDAYDLRNYVFGDYINGTETTDMGMLANMFNDGYLRYQYLKENSGASGVLAFLCIDTDVEPKEPYDLPLAYETYAPRSEIMARTSWQDGINSPAVSVSMNMNERRSGDHDHADIGSFQLYYKGPLTIPGGIYSGEDWGGPHWRNYFTRTVASNSITVYNPDEVFTYGPHTAEANDGGQEMIANSAGEYVISDYAEHFSDSNIRAVTEGTYIGPNEKTPAFSYIKGDITNAYSDTKMESYKRGMVFMDTFNETYPGVMVVFDRVVSKDASFDKKWLLQSVTDPAVNGNKITITNTLDGANGKLVNTTLLPESVTITEVGGLDTYITNGVEYAAPESTASAAYRSGYRLEVAPTAENTEDIFLNAMYVTDADGNAAALPMIKESTNEFVGVTTLDRMVMFSKTGGAISSQFNITVRDNNNSGEMLVLLTDIAPGKWTVSGGNVSLTVESVSGDNCLVFSVVPGTFTVSPAAADATLSTLTWEETEKGNFGDFAVKLDKGYLYTPDVTYLNNGVPYISVDTAAQLGCVVTESENTVNVIRGSHTSVLTVGQNYYTFDGVQIPVDNSVIIHNGKIYIPVGDFGTAFAVKSYYASNANVLKITSGTTLDAENVIQPVSITGISSQVLLCDEVTGDAISFSPSAAPYTNTPVTYYLGADLKRVTEIVAATSGSLLNVDIFASADGENYYKITGEQTTATTGVKSLEVDALARYIRFVPRSSISISELAVCGTNATAKIGFLSERITVFDKNADINTSIYLADGFDSASLYIGGTKVYDFAGGDTDCIHNVNVDSSLIEGFADGTYNLKINATYNGSLYTISRGIKLTSGGTVSEIVNRNFSGSTVSEAFATVSGQTYTFSRNLNGNATESIIDGAYRLDFDKVVASSAPFVVVNNLNSGNGVYEACFDTYLSSENIGLTLELRTKAITYPESGPSYQLFFGQSGLLKTKVVLDTVNEIMEVYIENANGDMVLFDQKTLLIDGLGQLRFTYTTRNSEPSYITLDNILVNYKEMAPPAEEAIVSEHAVYIQDFAEAVAGSVLYAPNSTATPADFEVADGALVFQRPADSTLAASIYYALPATYYNDVMAFSFDSTFTGINASDAAGSVFGINVSELYNGVSTGWCFFGDSRPHIEKAADSETLTFGNAILEQNTKYNIRYEIMIPDRVYNIYVTDTASGTTTLAHSGIISDEFDDIKLLNFYINKNYSPVWTIDNIVVDYNSSHTPALVINEENIEVSEEGTITFGAILPEGYSSGDIYINDVFSSSILPIDGVTCQDVTATLPEGTLLGDATIRYEASGSDGIVEISRDIHLTRNIIINHVTVDTPTGTASPYGLRAFASGGSLAISSEDSGVWEITEKGQIDVTKIEPRLEGGVYDLSFDFRTSTVLNNIRVRMTYNTSNGTGMTISGDGSAYHYYSNNSSGLFGSLAYKLGSGDSDWNNVRIRVDYVNSVYHAYLNGSLAESGTFAANGYAGIQDARIIFVGNASTDKIFVDNFKIDEVLDVNAPADVTVNYATGYSKTYAGETLSSIDLSNIDFVLPVAADETSINAENVFVLNPDGEALPMVISYSDGKVNARYSGSTLASGTYKLVLGSGITVNGATVGANVETPFELSSMIIEDNFNIKNNKFTLGNGIDRTNSYVATAGEDGSGAIYAVSTVNNSTSFVQPTLGTLLYTGRTCYEGDIKLDENTMLYTELGFNKMGTASTSTDYHTASDSLGNASAYLFGADGTVAGTETTYTADDWMHFKYVIDLNQLRYEFYLDGNLVTTKNMTYANILDYTDTVALYSKIRFNIRQISTEEGATPAAITIDNIKVYEEN